jgi:hypothetical protein
MGQHECDVFTFISIDRIESACAATAAGSHDLRLDIINSACPGDAAFFSSSLYERCDKVRAPLQVES